MLSIREWETLHLSFWPLNLHKTFSHPKQSKPDLIPSHSSSISANFFAATLGQALNLLFFFFFTRGGSSAATIAYNHRSAQSLELLETVTHLIKDILQPFLSSKVTLEIPHKSKFSRKPRSQLLPFPKLEPVPLSSIPYLIFIFIFHAN